MKKYFLALWMLSCAYSSISASEVSVVKMQTNQGDILIELDAKHAPKTVENFLRYVKEDFYTGTIFHRVIDNFMIQGGGFTSDYEQKTTHEPIQNEANNGLKNDRGTIAMARTGEPHSATAQFFINVNDNHFLNYTESTPRGWGYAVFGKVIKGVEVVDKIKSVETGQGGPFKKDVPLTPIIIEKVSLEEAKPEKPPATTEKKPSKESKEHKENKEEHKEHKEEGKQ